MNWMPPPEEPDDQADQIESGDEPKTMPLSGITRPQGLPEADDFSGVDEQGGKKPLTANAALILGVAAVAAASIFLMRLTQDELTNPASNDVVAKIDTAIAKLSNPDQLDDNSILRPEVRQATFRDTDTIVSMFLTDPTARQVPLKFTKKNPFRMAQPEPEQPDQAQAADPAAKEKQHRALVEKLKREVGAMNLQSVLGGANPVAVVDGEFYRQGAKLGSFKIEKINELAVQLSASGETFRLTIDQ